MSVPRLRRREEAGFTFVELLVTMTIFVTVMALVIPTYMIASQSSTNTTSMTTDDSAIVPAVGRLASQLDNATYLWSPCDSTGTSYLNSGISTCQSTTSSGGPGGSAILLYYYVVGPQHGQQYGSVTNTVPSTGTSALHGYCSQWRVYNGLLQDRIWASTSPPSSLVFTTVPTGLTITSNSNGQPPFAVEGSSGNGSKIIDIDFMIRPASSNSPSQEFQTSLAAQQALLATGLSNQPTPSCSPPPDVMKPSPSVRVAVNRLIRRGGADEAGFAMIAVVLMLSVLVLMAVIAFTETGVNSNNTLRTASAAQADAAANAGLSASVYGIVNTTNGNFPCSVTSQSSGNEQYLLNTAQDPPNEGNEQFSTTITYYTSSWTPGATPSAAVTGSGPGGCPTSADPTPGAAVITSTGISKMANFSSSEVVQEQLQIEVASQSYVAFSGSGTPMDLHNLEVLPPSSSAGGVGTIYSNGPVTNSGSCGSKGPGATIVAFGNSTLTNCGPVAGSIEVGSGNLTLSHTAVPNGNVQVSGGYLVMSDGGNPAAVNASASDDVYLCDQEAASAQPSPQCSGLTYGTMNLQSATSSTGVVHVGSFMPPSSSSTFGPYHGVTVGSITNTSGFAVTPPSNFSLPTLGTPSQSAWSAIGYSTWEPTSDCTDPATHSGSVLNYLANITSNTVIVANCGSGGLNLTNAGNISLGVNSGTKTNYNVALLVSGTGGITLGGGMQFQAPGAGNVQLTLAETEPTGFSYSSSCTSPNYNITDSNGNVAQAAVDMFIYTPCTFSFSGGGTINGEIMAGNLSLTKQLIMSYAPFTPPGLVFGYLAIVQQRQVVQL